MSTEETLQILSTSSSETEQLAEQIGRNLRGGETIELASDLGGGKTTFVHGLAKGMGSSDNVASPTFTISREYHTEHLVMHHFDFYRLPKPGLISHELFEVLNKPYNVVVIEWADIVQGVLPKKRLKVRFNTTSETTRKLQLNYPPELSYLIEGLN